jgi:type II secretion system protein C
MKQNKTKSYITILNVILLLLLAFIGFQTVEKVFSAQMEPTTMEPAAAKNNTLIRNTLFSSNHPISDYKPVWERNLFNISQKAISPPKNQIRFASVAKADHNIGLKLVGTVETNVLKNMAIIEDNNGQNIYREGEAASGYVIKKILRNNVIISTANGDKLLALTSDSPSPGGVVLASSSQPKPKASIPNRSGGRYKTVELPREVIMAAFDDIDQLVEKVGPLSYMSGKLAGFKIGTVPDKSILKKIGLRSHDKIIALNDKSIDGSNGAFKFFEQIAEGKKVTIKYRRRNRTRIIELNPI